MPVINNKRIYYAIQQLTITKDSSADYAISAPDAIPYAVRGLQSFSMNTNFNLETISQLGQLSPYENIEDLPSIDMSLSKVLDGNIPLFCQATADATNPTLAGRANAKCMVHLSIFDDSKESATGTPGSVVAMSDVYAGSSSFSFGVDGVFTEDLTLNGNNKVWAAHDTHSHGETLDPNIPDPFAYGVFNGNDSPAATEGVNRRENLLYTYDPASGLDSAGMVADPDCTILPPEVFGISNSGTNEESTPGEYDAHVQSITVSCDLGRENILELGRRLPYHRNVSFPVSVSTEITVMATSGDMISATESGIYTTGNSYCEDLGNLKERPIRIATCEGTRIYLGKKNKLSSISYGGADAGGGNATVTYSFETQNDYTVMHSGDVSGVDGTPRAGATGGPDWWTNRATYLVDA